MTKINLIKLILLSVFLYAFSSQASPSLNFTPTSRGTLTENQFIEKVVKSAGIAVLSKDNLLTDKEELTQTFLFQKNRFAPLTVSFNQHRLLISWDIPKANTKELYEANSENQRTMINLLSFLFGNSDLIYMMQSPQMNSYQSLSSNGLWTIKLQKTASTVLLEITPN